MSGRLFLKPAGATLDYGFDWSAAYLAGRTIVTSGWVAEPPAADGGVAVVAHAHEGGATRCTVAGGAPRTLVALANRVTLSDGQADERRHALLIGEGR